MNLHHFDNKKKLRKSCHLLTFVSIFSCLIVVFALFFNSLTLLFKSNNIITDDYSIDCNNSLTSNANGYSNGEKLEIPARYLCSQGIPDDGWDTVTCETRGEYIDPYSGKSYQAIGIKDCNSIDFGKLGVDYSDDDTYHYKDLIDNPDPFVGNVDDIKFNKAIGLTFTTPSTIATIRYQEGHVFFNNYEYVVTEIMESAFEEYNRAHLYCNIIIPSTIKKIGRSAFNECNGGYDRGGGRDMEGKGCARIIFHERQQGKAGGSVIKEGLVSIGKRAFYKTGFYGYQDNPNEISTLSFPSTLESIGEEAFCCTSDDSEPSWDRDRIYWTHIEFDHATSLKTIGKRAFFGVYDVRTNGVTGLDKTSLTSIGEKAFTTNNNTNITLKLPKTIEKLGEEVFSFNNKYFQGFYIYDLDLSEVNPELLWQWGHNSTLYFNVGLQGINGLPEGYNRIIIHLPFWDGNDLHVLYSIDGLRFIEFSGATEANYRYSNGEGEKQERVEKKEITVNFDWATPVSRFFFFNKIDLTFQNTMLKYYGVNFWLPNDYGKVTQEQLSNLKTILSTEIGKHSKVATDLVTVNDTMLLDPADTSVSLDKPSRHEIFPGETETFNFMINDHFKYDSDVKRYGIGLDNVFDTMEIKYNDGESKEIDPYAFFDINREKVQITVRPYIYSGTYKFEGFLTYVPLETTYWTEYPTDAKGQPILSYISIYDVLKIASNIELDKDELIIRYNSNYTNVSLLSLSYDLHFISPINWESSSSHASWKLCDENYQEIDISDNDTLDITTTNNFLNVPAPCSIRLKDGASDPRGYQIYYLYVFLEWNGQIIDNMFDYVRIIVLLDNFHLQISPNPICLYDNNTTFNCSASIPNLPDALEKYFTIHWQIFDHKDGEAIDCSDKFTFITQTQDQNSILGEIINVGCLDKDWILKKDTLTIKATVLDNDDNFDEVDIKVLLGLSLNQASPYISYRHLSFGYSYGWSVCYQSIPLSSANLSIDAIPVKEGSQLPKFTVIYNDLSFDIQFSNKNPVGDYRFQLKISGLINNIEFSLFSSIISLYVGDTNFALYGGSESFNLVQNQAVYDDSLWNLYVNDSYYDAYSKKYSIIDNNNDQSFCSSVDDFGHVSLIYNSNDLPKKAYTIQVVCMAYIDSIIEPVNVYSSNIIINFINKNDLVYVDTLTPDLINSPYMCNGSSEKFQARLTQYARTKYELLSDDYEVVGDDTNFFSFDENSGKVLWNDKLLPSAYAFAVKANLILKDISNGDKIKLSVYSKTIHVNINSLNLPITMFNVVDGFSGLLPNGTLKFSHVNNDDIKIIDAQFDSSKFVFNYLNKSMYVTKPLSSETDKKFDATFYIEYNGVKCIYNCTFYFNYKRTIPFTFTITMFLFLPFVLILSIRFIVHLISKQKKSKKRLLQNA